MPVPSTDADPPSAESAAATGRRRSLLCAIRDGLRGSDEDLTKGPLDRAVILLSVPMVIEMLMESLFAITDVFFVSRLGADAIATIGLTESLLTIIYTIAMGLSIGATAVVARRIGEGDRDGAAIAAVQALLLGLVVAVVIGGLGASFAPQLLRLMGADDGVIRTGTGYATVMLAGEASFILIFLLNAAFRGAGDAQVAMRALILANGLNIVLAPCFIFGVGPFPELGVTGAGVGTTTGRFCGVFYLLWSLTRPGGRLRVEARHLRLDVPAMRGMLQLAASGTFQYFVSTASWIGLTRILASFGGHTVAGYTIAIRCIIFALLPSWGLANAAATLVGQSLGAGDPGRARAAVMLAGRYNMYFLGAVAVLFLAAAGPIVAIFTTDPTVAPVAEHALRLIALGYPFYAWGMVFTNAFNGAGDTRTPTLVNLACFWAFELPLAWGLSRLPAVGPDGVFASVAIAFSVVAVVSGILFRRGRWAAQQV